MSAPRLQLTCAGLLLGALVAVVEAEDAMWWAPWLKPMRTRIPFIASKGIGQIAEISEHKYQLQATTKCDAPLDM